ncbi:MAG: zf-HC2 domain-containing protein [Myxococcales bacterium]|nr:zf-HC2 domain-containing protein [Myxococcales bacterium]
MSGTEMTCQELADFLMAYDDGELPSDQRTVFDEHLQMCPPCLTYLETYRETVRLGKSLCDEPEGAPPPECPEALVNAILTARKSGQ